MVLLFDAVNTLIYKPSFYKAFLNVLDRYGHKIDEYKFQYIHKLLSETHDFPDRTTKEFYIKFNSELLYALGIIPNYNLLDDLFKTCSYLPWEKFEDTKFLETIKHNKAIISNFHRDLTKIIDSLFGSLFSKIITSEEESERKPNPKFFERAINILNVKPDEVFYIGDSIKLDIEPAIELGIKAVLIDRGNIYEKSNLIRITDMAQLKYLI
jgi:FMN phosphatase YigB (HAD superfamily)